VAKKGKKSKQRKKLAKKLIKKAKKVARKEAKKEVRKEEEKERKELNAVLEDAESENKDLEDTEVSEDKPPSSPFSS